MAVNHLQVIYFQRSTNVLYDYISQNLSELITGVLTNYKCISQNDQNIKYIQEYIKYHIIKNNSQISQLLVDGLFTDNDIMKNCSEQLKSSLLIDNNIRKFKNDNISSFNLPSGHNLKKIKTAWKNMEKACKNLFISEQGYIDFHILSDTFSYPRSLDLVFDSDVKELFLHYKNNSCIQNKKENETKLKNFQHDLTEHTLKLSGLTQEEHKLYDARYAQYVNIALNLGKYINTEVILPVVSTILCSFDAEKKIDVTAINDYVVSNYNLNYSLHYFIFFRELLLQQKQKDETLSKAVIDFSYIELLHKTCKTIISLLSIKEILSKSNFKTLDENMQKLYQSEEAYNKLLMVQNYNWEFSEEILRIFIDESKKLVQEGLLSVKKLDYNGNSFANNLYNFANMAYNHKGAIALALLSVCGLYGAYGAYGAVAAFNLSQKFATLYSAFNTIRNSVFAIESAVHLKDVFKAQINNLNNLIENNTKQPPVTKEVNVHHNNKDTKKR